MTIANTAIDKITQTSQGPDSGRARSSWSWVAIGCVLLGASGVVRVMQDRQHLTEHAYKEVCPIDLTKIPVTLGDWHLVKGSEKPLDALTMVITGGSDHIVRTYVNDYTGVSMMLLVLYGPAEPVLPHTPSICYPSSGFFAGDGAASREINYSLNKNAEDQTLAGQAMFQSATYFKPNGRIVLREAVYHSFRLDGRWSPFIGSDRKFPRRNPGIFKIQIQRQIAENETIGPGDPIEQFLTLLIGEIEAEIKTAGTKKIAAL